MYINHEFQNTIELKNNNNKEAMERNSILDGYYISTKTEVSVYVKLTPDKPLAPGHFIPPVKWTGYVQKEEVEIIQKTLFAYTQSDFEFSKYPEEYEDIKDKIIKGIDEAMRMMD